MVSNTTKGLLLAGAGVAGFLWLRSQQPEEEEVFGGGSIPTSGFGGGDAFFGEPQDIGGFESTLPDFAALGAESLGGGSSGGGEDVFEDFFAPEDEQLGTKKGGVTARDVIDIILGSTPATRTSQFTMPDNAFFSQFVPPSEAILPNFVAPPKEDSTFTKLKSALKRVSKPSSLRSIVQQIGDLTKKGKVSAGEALYAIDSSLGRTRTELSDHRIAIGDNLDTIGATRARLMGINPYPSKKATTTVVRSSSSSKPTISNMFVAPTSSSKPKKTVKVASSILSKAKSSASNVFSSIAGLKQ